MPVHNNRQKKAETAEKIKEIQQRQKNWLRQRASSLDREKTRSPSPAGTKVQSDSQNVASGAPRSLPASKIANSAAFKASTTEKEPYQTASTYTLRDKATTNSSATSSGFQRWQENRTSTKPSTADSEFYVSGTGQADVLRVVHSPTNQEWTPSPSSFSTASNSTLSPDMFGSLADQIVSRVKRELNLQGNVPMTNISFKDDKPYSPDVYKDSKVCHKHDKVTQPSNITSHRCPKCHQTMLAPDYSPMLLIPCGHSFCKTCAERSDSCITCGQAIQSLTCNIMLLQIIADYNASSTSSSQKDNAESAQYSTQKYEEEQDYSEEYQSFCVRCEAVVMETEDIQSKITDYDKKIEAEEAQISHISAAQSRMQTEINNLQIKMEDLERHKKGYRDKIGEWNKKKQAQENKLMLTNDTLKHLEEKRKKLKKLMDGEG